MAFIVVAVLAGLAIGFARGGRLRHLGSASFRLWPLLAIGILLQVAAEALSHDVGFAALLGSYVALVVFAVANLRLVGMALVAIGIALNALVIGINSGMPVRDDAIVTAGIASREELPHIRFGTKRHLERSSDQLTILGDVIPIPVAGEVLSFGDLIMSVGVANVLVGLLRLRPGRTSQEAPA